MSSVRPDCEMCGQPYHRYSPDDPEHDYNPVACLNACRAYIERLERVAEAARTLRWTPVNGGDVRGRWQDLTDALRDLRERVTHTPENENSHDA